MDIYTHNDNSHLAYLSPAMRNLYRWLWRTNAGFKRRHPTVDSIRHANVVDIHPDASRVREIANNVDSIECMVDQLPLVGSASILVVNVPVGYQEPTEGLLVSNVHTKLIVVIGNVQNIRLLVDDIDTIVYHRIFQFAELTGIVIGDNYNDDGSLKPTYTVVRDDNPYPAVYGVVNGFGIGFVSEANRSDFASGDNWVYLLHPGSTLNVLKGAKVVAIRNNSSFDPETENMRNTVIVHGQPTSFKCENDSLQKVSQAVRNGFVLLANMTNSEIKTNLVDDKVFGYDYNPQAIDGFNAVIDYNRGISPARRILMVAGLPEETIDELAYKVDNPFSFAFIRRRNTKGYELLKYALLKDNSVSDRILAVEKLKIVYDSVRNKTVDLFNRDRYLALRRSQAPEYPFTRELPRIDAYGEKRLAIVKRADNDSMLSVLVEQKKNFVIGTTGAYIVEGYHNVYIWCEQPAGERVDVYVHDCGKVIVHAKEHTVCKVHIIGKVHTMLCSDACDVICHFAHEQNSFIDSLVYSEPTDDIALFTDVDNSVLIDDFQRTTAHLPTQHNEPLTPYNASQPLSAAKVRHLFCNTHRLTGASLVDIGRLSENP